MVSNWRFIGLPSGFDLIYAYVEKCCPCQKKESKNNIIWVWKAALLSVCTLVCRLPALQSINDQSEIFRYCKYLPKLLIVLQIAYAGDSFWICIWRFESFWEEKIWLQFENIDIWQKYDQNVLQERGLRIKLVPGFHRLEYEHFAMLLSFNIPQELIWRCSIFKDSR